MPSRISCLIRWSWSPPYSRSVVPRRKSSLASMSASSSSSGTRPTWATPDARRQQPAAGHPDADGELLAVGAEHPVDRQTLRVVGRVVLLLPAVRGQRLPEVPEPVEQADADDRHAQIGGRLEVVAGQDAKATRVVRQRLGDAELHREVGDRLRTGCASRWLTGADTSGDRSGSGPDRRQAVHPGEERLVRGEFLQPGHRHRAEQFERVALEAWPTAGGRCRRKGPGWPDARTTVGCGSTHRAVAAAAAAAVGR